MKLIVSGLYRADMPPSRSGWESGIERVPSRTANTGRRGHPGPGCPGARESGHANGHGWTQDGRAVLRRSYDCMHEGRPLP